MDKRYYAYTWYPVYTIPTNQTKVYCCLKDDTVIEAYHTCEGIFRLNGVLLEDVIMWALYNKLN